MKRSAPDKDSLYTRATKASRLSSRSTTSAGQLHVDHINTTIPSTHDDLEEDIHPNILLERLLSQKVNKMVEQFYIAPRPLRNISGEKIIPSFDPDNHECNVKNWLAKIEQLGLVHKWDDYSKIVIMQTRLAGQAQLWFNRLDEYDYTWEQWKTLLLKAFPRSFEYADMLEELVGRKKLNTETITHYYHDKLAMCRRCRLDDAASLSCIIKGLPLDLQNNAKAFKCDTPEEFYSGYLSAFENYRNKDVTNPPNNSITPSYHRVVKTDTDKRRTTDLPIPSTSRLFPSTTLRRMNCFRCNSTDHIVKDCPVPDRRICKFCSVTGHNINRCPKIDDLMKKGKSDTIPINIIQSLNEIYKKEVKVGAQFFCGYLDTGAQLNVVSLRMVNSLNYRVNETDALLKGFTGDTVPAMGQISLTMSIDGLSFDTTAVVTHMKLPANVDIIIGQPVINSEGISLVTTQKSATLKENTDYDFDLPDTKYKVISSCDVRIQPRESCFVEVNILGNTSDGDVCTKPRFHDLDNKHFAVPATLLTGSNGFVKVYNMGLEDVLWLKGDTITRAVPCEIPDESSTQSATKLNKKNILTTDGGGSTSLQADKIKMSIVPLMFRDWWDEWDRPSRLLDQHFGTGLNREELLTSLSSMPSTSLLRNSYFRPWRTNLTRQESASTINLTKEKFEVILDVQQFAPEEITVKASNNSVLVEGKHEEKQDEHGFISRQFTRRYILPAGYDVADLVSSLSSDGVLTVTAPKRPPPSNGERIVPITKTGPVKQPEPVKVEQQTPREQTVPIVTSP